jgi:Family of unknown function (DUF6171)
MQVTPKMIYSALKAMYWFITSGCEKLPERDRNERFAHCKGCAMLQASMRCGMCGCWVRIKTWLPKEACPADKWVAVK